MAQNNPQIEKFTIWGFTEEEIDHRWEMAEMFNPVNRIFGSSSGSDNKSKNPAKNAANFNTEQTMDILERLLPPSEGE